MAFWHKLAAKLTSRDGQNASSDVLTSLIYILLPAELEPDERHALYEDALQAELELADLGCVSGGGTLLGEESADGSRDVLHCGIDVDTTDVDRARVLLRLHLPELGCPVGTRLYFDAVDGTSLFDEFDGLAWRLDMPGSGDDPRFG